MAFSVGAPAPVATTSAATGGVDTTNPAAELAVAANVAAQLMPDVSAALDDVLGQGVDNADAESLLRLQLSTAALDVWSSATSAAAKAGKDPLDQIAKRIG
jgi:hypothetical protein